MANEAFGADALREHNVYREKHGVPALKLSTRLCESAQEWADTLLNQSRLMNSPLSNRGEVGESISMRRGSESVDIGGAEASTQWYNDVARYDFKRSVGEAGNFTQLVWASTTEVGFGKARSNDCSRCIVVAHYSPPGNIVGLYDQNVKPAASQLETGEKTEEHEDAATKSKEGNRKETIVIERAVSPSGRHFVIRRSVKQSRTPEGQVVRKITEIEFDSEKEALCYQTTASRRDESESESSDDDGQLPDLSSKSAEERRKIEESRKFRREVLAIHNRLREAHGADRLTRSPELESAAQKWAEHLVGLPNLANSNNLFKFTRVGENIASRRSSAPCDYSAKEVVEHWYEEKSKYGFAGEPRDVQGVGNFTQIVWKATKEIGVGKAVQKDANGATRIVVVCQYYPAGNVLTQFANNVPKLQKHLERN